VCVIYSGCRVGKDCPFIHQEGEVKPNNTRSNAVPGEPGARGPQRQETTVPRDRRQAVQGSVHASRVVARPVPVAQIQDPREFQLAQVRRRYNPKESTSKSNSVLGSEESATVLEIKMKPSDPDFPFEMDVLHFMLYIPAEYPDAELRITVQNKDIPRGFALNIESGFDALASNRGDATILSLITSLDRNLENFLSQKKAETITFVANADRRHVAALRVRSVAPEPQNVPATKSQNTTERPKQVEVFFTNQQKTEAAARRASETRQIEARLGRLPLYKKSGDGIAYTIPIEPRKRSELPAPLQAVKTIKVFVPLLYPLHPCRVQLDGVNPEDSKHLETAFEEKAKRSNELSLMNHINSFAQTMHIMAIRPPAISELKPVKHVPDEAVPGPSEPSAAQAGVDGDRSHIKVIPRPPEWDVIDSDDANSTDDDYSYDSGDESDGANIKADPDLDQKYIGDTTAPAPNPEKGTALSFPFIELYGIELLEVTVLNLTVKCERCRDTMEINGLKSGPAKSESCKKCATQLSIGFRGDLIHSNAVRAGFLDLEGCTVVDMLPSSFLPTCSSCSTTYPLPGIVSVRGETVSNVCRECHQKFTFKIPEVKFLRISSSAHLPPASGPRRKREVLGLVAGTELPRRGRCKHYSKSYRWFRFSCCQKVYACDRCHDESEEHPNEHANRMVCGWCSREQNYRPDDCGICHGVLVGKKGSGFWEGGKGTRDRVRMSRKDKRKFRRAGGDKT
jgi:uncharacterized CHY-type Zn-finger protein